MLSRSQIPDAALFDIKVAVGEALANAVRHGSPGGPADEVDIDVSAYDDRVVDQGDATRAADSRATRRARATSTRPAGAASCSCARSWTVSSSRSRPEGGTIVTLVKHLRPDGRVMR